MEKLVKRQLLNAGLVRLTPHLLLRYNKCLISMGLEPTELTDVDIDGLGVSPQVARERGNPHYLASGIANPLAMILCPEQYGKPIYHPIFSWQRPLMRALFDKYHKEIADITGTHAIAVDLEEGFSSYEAPEDLLLITTIMAVPHIEELAEAACEQAALLATFSDGLNCLREQVCDALVVSRKKHGDLRKRRVAMAPVPFDGFDDFYTVAFGGAAVLRHVDGEDLLILEQEEAFTATRKNRRRPRGAQAFYLFDPECRLFERLLACNWIHVPVDRYREDPSHLEFKKELLLADALCDCEPEVNWRTLASAAHKALLRKHQDKVPAIYFELEHYAATLKAGRVSTLSTELLHFLAEPSPRMHPETQIVLWILLSHAEPRNLLALYTVDKNAFLARYEQWSDAKREWAADYLAERYKHQHRVTD